MSSTQWMVVVGLLLTAAGPASAQSGGDFVPVTDAMLQDPDPADWLMWRRTLDSWGYSPLDQIDRQNVDTLRLVWSRAIRDKVSRSPDDPDRMPPWFIEKNVGIQKFEDDPSLSDDEISLIAS